MTESPEVSISISLKNLGLDQDVCLQVSGRRFDTNYRLHRKICRGKEIILEAHFSPYSPIVENLIIELCRLDYANGYVTNHKVLDGEILTIKAHVKDHFDGSLSIFNPRSITDSKFISAFTFIHTVMYADEAYFPYIGC